MNRRTLYIQYEGTRPFITATVYDENDRIMWWACDTSIRNLLRDCKLLFRGYDIQSRLPGVKK